MPMSEAVDCGTPATGSNAVAATPAGTRYRAYGIVTCASGYSWSDGSVMKFISCMSNKMWTTFTGTCQGSYCLTIYLVYKIKQL